MTTGKRSGPCFNVLPESKRYRLDQDLFQDTGQYGRKLAKREGAVDFDIKAGRRVEETTESFVSRSRFDLLPMEILIIILSKLAASADCALDFVSVLATSRIFNIVGGDSDVLAHASLRVFDIGIHQWCESAHRFFNHCVEAGNAEACYSLGMIQFYCLENRSIGLSLLAKAAKRFHAQSLYSLAVIEFNGSGRPSKKGKDLCLGAALCSWAAFLGNVDALRELGHCFCDGYGVKKDECKGRKLLIEANVPPRMVGRQA
ncbi:hypothetical protein MLD38_017046 [Melastoma candidum]|uniref:Uncharacterized protein n=1 Tax=Melastoma candidum TaxID=119954 RepID=A0ACB9QSV3_9MYRT|nr:hypothetical protein MLD38_017046 [Melastoma candidum]